MIRVVLQWSVRIPPAWHAKSNDSGSDRGDGPGSPALLCHGTISLVVAAALGAKTS